MFRILKRVQKIAGHVIGNTMEKLDRKKFFSFITKGALAVSFISSVPVKYLSSLKKASEKNINIKIHPEAVKRNKV